MAEKRGAPLWTIVNGLAGLGIAALLGVHFLMTPAEDSAPVAEGQQVVYSLAENRVISGAADTSPTQATGESAADKSAVAPEALPADTWDDAPERDANTPPGMPPLPDEADAEGGFLEEAPEPAAPATDSQPNPEAPPEDESGFLIEDEGGFPDNEGGFMEAAPAQQPGSVPPATRLEDEDGASPLAGTLPAQEVAPVAIKTVPPEQLVGGEREQLEKPAGFARTTLPDLPERSGASVAMHEAPSPKLQEKAEEGYLPRIADDGTEPWHYYARPFPRANAGIPVAIIIADLGMNRTLTDTALRLPEEVTIAISAYAPNASGWFKKARTLGHETLLQLAMQPANYPYADPGPRALLNDLNPLDNSERLEWNLAQGVGYVGVLTPPDEVFTTSAASAELFRELKRRGLAMVRAAPTQVESASIPAAEVGTRFINVDMILDAEVSESGIKKKLQMLETRARAKGHAVAVARPYALSLNQLNRWFQVMESRGLVLAPVSAVAKTGTATY